MKRLALRLQGVDPVGLERELREMDEAKRQREVDRERVDREAERRRLRLGFEMRRRGG